MNHFIKYSIVLIIITLNSCQTTFDTIEVTTSIIKYYLSNNSIVLAKYEIREQPDYKKKFNIFSSEEKLIEYIKGLVKCGSDSTKISNYLNSNKNKIIGYFPGYGFSNNKDFKSTEVIRRSVEINNFNNFPFKFHEVIYKKSGYGKYKGIYVSVIYKNNLSYSYYFNLTYYYFEFALIDGVLYYVKSNFVIS